MALTQDQQRLMLDLLRQASVDDLNLLGEQIRDLRRGARRAVAAVETASLHGGSTAMFNENARPRYLEGTLVTVVKVNRTTIAVRIQDSESRGAQRFPGVVRAPKTMISPVPAEVNLDANAAALEKL